MDACNCCKNVESGDPEMYSFEQFGILIEFVGEGGKELVLGQQ